MSDDLSALRQEVAAVRDELAALKKSHRELLERLMDMPVDANERWPRYLNLEADCLAVRNDQKPIPLLLRSDEVGAAITFMDESFRTRLEILIGNDGAQIELRNAEGKVVFHAGEGSDGSGQVRVADREGQPRAGLRVNEFGGLVHVVDKAGKALALMLGLETGGETHTVNAMHNGSVAIKATPTGGQVCVNDPSGQRMTFLAATTETGIVSVHGPHGELAAGLAGTDEGGKVVFHDLDGRIIGTLP